MLDILETIKQIEDYLYPALKMTIRERSLYYHFFRHTRLIGLDSGLFAINPLSDKLDIAKSSVRESIREMAQKGCIQIDLSHQGHQVRVLLPNEIEGVLPAEAPIENIDIESIDFYTQR
jgi:hypothetical protein